MGTNGMSVKRKIVAGSSAISMLKAMDEALVTSTPRPNSPLTISFATSSSGALSKPGRTAFLILLVIAISVFLALIQGYQ